MLMRFELTGSRMDADAVQETSRSWAATADLAGAPAHTFSNRVRSLLKLPVRIKN